MEKKYKILQKKVVPLQYSAVAEYLELNGNMGFIEKPEKYKPKTLFPEPGFTGLTSFITIDLSTLRESLEAYL